MYYLVYETKGKKTMINEKNKKSIYLKKKKSGVPGLEGNTF